MKLLVAKQTKGVIEFCFLGFLYKVVHKISRLRKFNRSREIEINFLTAWTKFGTLVQHAPGYKTLPQFFFNFGPATRLWYFKEKKG